MIGFICPNCKRQSIGHLKYISLVDATRLNLHCYQCNKDIEALFVLKVVSKPVTVFIAGDCVGGKGGIAIGELDEAGNLYIINQLTYVGTTKSRMELLALIKAIEWNQGSLNIQTNSTYVFNPINRGWLWEWRSNNWNEADGADQIINTDLWERVAAALESRQINVVLDTTSAYSQRITKAARDVIGEEN